MKLFAVGALASLAAAENWDPRSPSSSRTRTSWSSSTRSSSSPCRPHVVTTAVTVSACSAFSKATPSSSGLGWGNRPQIRRGNDNNAAYGWGNYNGDQRTPSSSSCRPYVTTTGITVSACSGSSSSVYSSSPSGFSSYGSFASGSSLYSPSASSSIASSSSPSGVGPSSSSISGSLEPSSSSYGVSASSSASSARATISEASVTGASSTRSFQDRDVSSSTVLTVTKPSDNATATAFPTRTGNSTLSASPSVSKSTTISATGTPCAGNSASSRSQWCGHDINTDYYNEVPDTGVTREYWFDLQQTQGAPDGVSRMLLTVNGSMPGPTIFADWGDEVIVHVANNMPAEMKNGTSIHFHGLRQNYTNQQDGVVSVTQCPLAPGKVETYKWRATQYGSSWYHSHFGLQAWEGIFGGIVIHGPASANYDVDLGNLFLMDWDHQTADEMYVQALLQGGIATDTGLINGTNVWGDDGDADQVGHRFETTFQSGTSYLLRLVNPSIDTHWKFAIDNHTLTVIAADFVPIQPIEGVTTLSIGMGQRYDVIVTANQAAVASDFWMRAIPQIACSDNDNAENIRGIVHYGSSTGLPTTSGWDYIDECVDEPGVVPIIAKNVGGADHYFSEAASAVKNSNGFFEWTLNETSYLVGWNDPTLLNVYNNETSDFVNTTNKLEIPNKGEWVYLLITEAFIPVAHPIHLHGHDFFVLGSGVGPYHASTANLTLSNPPRRDVALLPAAGWLLIAFETDNPGAWIMHCHIGWHTLEGFALQFLEMESEIHSHNIIDGDRLNTICDDWNSYASNHVVTQGEFGLVDSGLKRRDLVGSMDGSRF